MILKGLRLFVSHPVFNTVAAECFDQISHLHGVVESDRLEIRPALVWCDDEGNCAHGVVDV